ncbi:MAG: BadF/BadG/BcrA/BcrD ATPase family protein [Flavobacteriales bacterium]
MYKVIADSGSTKTDWVIIDSNSEIVEKIKTIGFNPYFQTAEFIFNEIFKSFSKSKLDLDKVTEIHYYGAGCSSTERTTVVKNGLQPQFLKARIYVNHDMIAAARATLGNGDGIACILGTGANSCVWEDSEEKANIASHGYIFGDEGSGSHLGIELLKLYLSDKMDDELKKSFENEFKLSKDQILNTTYKESSPNVFLASFAYFYHANLHHKVLRDIIYKGFKNFFEVRIVPYPNFNSYELGFVGSIAFYYDEILKEVASEYGMSIKKITRCPIEELTEFHSDNQTVKQLG